MRTELFTRVDELTLSPIAALACEHRLRRGDRLFDETDSAREAYVVASGRIGVVNKSQSGRELMVALMDPGDLFGLMPLFDGLGHCAEARALEDSVVIRVPYGPIRELYERQPELLLAAARLLAERLRDMEDALADAVLLSVNGRTAKRLLKFSGEADEFRLPITQEELGGMIGASRECINKTIAAFGRLGWIHQADRHYVIIDREKLKASSRQQ